MRFDLPEQRDCKPNFRLEPAEKRTNCRGKWTFSTPLEPKGDAHYSFGVISNSTKTNWIPVRGSLTVTLRRADLD